MTKTSFSSWFKFVIGCCGIVAGIAVGVYVGVWVMFIGGLLGIANVLKSITVLSAEAIAMGLGFGILKMMFAGFVGWISALFIIIPSFGFISKIK